MSIKILERGKRKTVGHARCEICHSLLEFQEEDLHTSFQYNEREDWINCPVCGHAIKVFPSIAFGWEKTI